MGVGGVIEIIQHFQVHTHIQLCSCFGFSPTLELTPQHTPSSSIAAQFPKVTRYSKCVTENMATLEHGQADSVPSTNYTYTLLCDQDAACPLLQPSAPAQPIYQQPQPAATQPQPPPQTGVQYHLQPYPAVSGSINIQQYKLAWIIRYSSPLVCSHKWPWASLSSQGWCHSREQPQDLRTLPSGSPSMPL